MGRDDDNRGTGTGDQSGRSRERRRPGIFFWVIATLLASAITFNAIDGDLLYVGTHAVLGLSLLMQYAKLQERSTAWRRAHNVCAVVFCVLALLLLLRNFGLL